MHLNADEIVSLLSYDELQAYSQSTGDTGTALIDNVIALVIGMCNGFLRTGGYKSIVDKTVVPDSLSFFIMSIVIHSLLKRIPVEIEVSRTASYDLAFSIMKDIGAGLFIPEGVERLEAENNGINQTGFSSNYRRRLSMLS